MESYEKLKSELKTANEELQLVKIELNQAQQKVQNAIANMDKLVKIQPAPQPESGYSPDDIAIDQAKDDKLTESQD